MATNDALIGRALAGRYRLQQRRGVGAHGIVLDAVDEQLQRPVAVKIMLPQFVETDALAARFRLEAQVAGSLNHPNLNAVYDWGVEEVEGTVVPYLVLEHLSGGSLRDMLDRGRLLTPSQALMVGLDACRGLDYMHRRGVIHRDLKPANLAFGDDRHLRILDVGISRMVAEQTWAEPSAAGIDAARYASPEQAKGGTPDDATLDSATDIYSLCLVMIEAVTGQVPFASDSTVATLNARIDKLMPVSADFGPLASVLSRAGSARAADRYSAAEFGRVLVQAAEKLPRPGILPIVGTGDSTGGMRRPGDPTGPMQRPEPTIAQAVVLPMPPADPVAHEPSSGAVQPVSDENPAPATESINALASAPPQLDIVMVNADTDGVPHMTSADADVAAAVVPAPPLEPPSPSQFPSMPIAQVSQSSPRELSIKMATESSPTSSTPMHAARVAAPSVAPTSGLRPAPAAPRASNDAPLLIAPRVLASDGVEPRLYDQSDDEFVQPKRRRIGWLVAILIVVVAAAVGAFVANRLLSEKSFAVPDLVGQAEAVARNQVSGKDWAVVVQKERNDVQPLGNVIRTDPAAGANLKEGSTIIFVVSDGPTLSVLPDVTGQTVEAATATLAAVNLSIALDKEVFCEKVPLAGELACDDVPAGSVISWMIAEQPLVVAGTEVMQQTVVGVTVSKGPAPRTVPNLKGLDEATAIKMMTDLGLMVVRDADIFSDEFVAGLVADQSLPEGTELAAGETVVYAVSKGVELVAMPAFDGLTYDQLFAAIEAVGLDVGAVSGPTDGSAPLTGVSVAGQPVVAGQPLPIGAVVDLTYTPPPETTVATTPPTTTAATG